MNFVVVAYYTKNTFYEDIIKVLENSLISLSIPYDIVGVENLGSWDKNTHYKPTFILSMLEKYNPKSVVYVDADAVFNKYPELFEKLDCDIAIHCLDISKYQKNRKIKELLSGTIFFKNSPKAINILTRWKDDCRNHPSVWDSKLLTTIVGDAYFNLPPEYCTIFDTMSDVKDPVITHFQASRRVRKNKGKLI